MDQGRFRAYLIGFSSLPSAFVLPPCSQVCVPTLASAYVSIVLRDIYKLDTTQIKTIRFYDTTFETSTVLRLFFKLVSSSNLPGSTLDRDDLINLAHFTKKWDCSTTANLRFSFIRNGLLQSYDNSVKTLKARRLVEPLTAFSVAAILGCKDICVLALEVPGQTWEQDLEDDDTMTNPMKGEPGTHPLRPAGWPMSMYGRIPVAYQLGALPHVVRVRRQP